MKGDGSLAQETCSGTSGTVEKCVGDYLYTCISGSPQWASDPPVYCGSGKCSDNKCVSTPKVSPTDKPSSSKPTGSSLPDANCSVDSCSGCSEDNCAAQNVPVDNLAWDQMYYGCNWDSATKQCVSISFNGCFGCTERSCCLMEECGLMWDEASQTCNTIVAKGPDIGNPVLPTFTPTPSITSVPTSVPTSTSTPTLTPTTVPTLASKLSFKITFAGIKPNATCLSNLGNIIVEVGNRPTSVSQTLSGLSVTPVSGEVDTLGNQVFKVTDLSLDTTKFGSVDTANYVKVKGPFHSRRRMCLNNQSTKIDETTTCDIDLHRTDDFVYNFARYTLLAGDVNQDNVIDLVDFSKVKNALNPGSAVNCGLAYDLNLDGVVNSIDLSLIRDNALASVDDE